jgi:DNA-binding response OmpR family regulator
MPFAGKHVLVVEDQYFIAADLGHCLEVQHADVELAASCADALDALGRAEFDFAVLDIKLGDDETSYPVAEELRRRGKPFVFVSGYETAREDFRDVRIFHKPVGAERVAAALLGVK